jgi:hypothetical protein
MRLGVSCINAPIFLSHLFRPADLFEECTDDLRAEICKGDGAPVKQYKKLTLCDHILCGVCPRSRKASSVRQLRAF